MYCVFALCAQFTPSHTSYFNSASHAPMCAYADVHTHTYTHMHTHTPHTHTHMYTQTVFDTLDRKIFLDARERSNPFEIIKGVIFQNRLTLVYVQYSTVDFNTARAVRMCILHSSIRLPYCLCCMCILHSSIRLPYCLGCMCILHSSSRLLMLLACCLYVA